MLADLDKRYLWHPFTQMRAWCDPTHEPIVLVEGRGAMLKDSLGREYIDGNSSIWTNIHGHAHPAISAAISAQLEKVHHVSFLGTANEPAILLAEKLVGLCAGSGFERVFYSDSGATSIEVAVKMALQYWQLVGRPEKSKFVAFDNAYHGDTAGAASLGGLGAFVDRFAPIHFSPLRVSGMGALNALGAGAGKEIAAIIIEPRIQGAAGLKLWPEGMLRELRGWCDREGVLLIFDEVFTGFGRTGAMFAGQTEGVWPDFLCLAKGLTGGTLPLAATLTSEQIFSAFLGEYEELKTFFYGHSYCGNPLACAAALASIDLFRAERTLESLAPKISLLADELSVLANSPRVKEIRRCGFIAGVELQEGPDSPLDWRAQTGARVCVAARKYGLLTRPILDTVAIIPPLCIEPAQIRQAVGALGRAITEVLH